jgi:amino acid permease
MAYTFQFNFFSFYKSLENPSDVGMLKITNRSLVSVMCIYIMTATFGYLTFGNATQSKILDN